jgi:hypothetical protein
MTTTNMKKILGTGTIVAGALVLGFTTFAHAALLTRQLDLGMTGSDVGSLQTFLAQDQTIYPQGLVTSYFGSLTASAVSNFQARNNIPTAGRVGPVTLVAINAQMQGGIASDSNSPVISNVSLSANSNTAFLHWSTSTQATGKVYYSTSPMPATESLYDVAINGNIAMTDAMLHSTQDVTISNLQSHTTYYYIVYTKDAAGNVQVTWPTTFMTQ